MNTKTAKKEFRKNVKRNLFNTLKKNNLKKIKTKLLTKDEVNIKDFQNYNSLLAKMAKNKIIHKNKVSRLVSRMNKFIQGKISK